MQTFLLAALMIWPSWRALGIVIVRDRSPTGLGAGQPCRVDSVDLAIRMAGGRLGDGAVMAIDAFSITRWHRACRRQPHNRGDTTRWQSQKQHVHIGMQRARHGHDRHWGTVF